MSDGLIVPAGAGQLIPGAAMTLKLGAEQTKLWSVFEAEVGPGFDVGAHRHTETEELFYLLEGELDLLAFEPNVVTAGDWQRWESRTGEPIARGGPGSLMWVPPGCPHAFANPGPAPARMLFLAAPAGHERYLRELAGILASGGPPDPAAIVEVRRRHDIQQLTPLKPGAGRA
jgi:quercetin dioxygenase-like cupin family protein